MSSFGQKAVVGAVVFMTMMAIPFWLEEESEKHKHNNSVDEVIAFTEAKLAEVTPQFPAISHHLVFSNGIRTISGQASMKRYSSSVEFYVTVPYRDLYRASPEVEQVVQHNFCSISERLGRYKLIFNSNVTDLSKEEIHSVKHDHNQTEYYQDVDIDCHERFTALYDREYSTMYQRLSKLPSFIGLHMYRQNEGIRASISHRLSLISWPYDDNYNAKIKALIEAGDFSFSKELKAYKQAYLYNYCSLSTAMKSFQVNSQVSLKQLSETDRKNIIDSGVFDLLNQYFDPFRARKQSCT